jgi:MoaA/NifB/PqqE/SkfB family radical SAM enzyme
MYSASTMRNIEINLGMVCNNRCVFCVNAKVRPAQRRWVAKNRIVAEIERAAAQGYRALGFLGGEVTICPHAAEVIRIARAHGFARISLCTNGRRLARREVLEALLDAGATRFTVSVHSHEPEVEDRLNARRGAFAEQLAGIDNLVRAAAAGRLPDGVSLNGCIHGLNFDRLTEMARFFRARGVRDIRFNFIRPEHLAAGNRELVPRLTDCIPEALRLIRASHRGLDMTVTFGDIPLCVWPARFLHRIDLARQHLGELRDLDTDVSEFRGGAAPFRFNWRRMRATRLKAHVRACTTCPARLLCEGPWEAYLELHGAGELHPIDRPALPSVPAAPRTPVRRPPPRHRRRTAAGGRPA